MKTAVTQLIERLKNDGNIVLSDNVVEFYLKEEKEQIINAYNKGKHISNCGGYDLTDKQYYKDTYTQSYE